MGAHARTHACICNERRLPFYQYILWHESTFQCLRFLAVLAYRVEEVCSTAAMSMPCVKHLALITSCTDVILGVHAIDKGSQRSNFAL